MGATCDKPDVQGNGWSFITSLSNDNDLLKFILWNNEQKYLMCFRSVPKRKLSIYENENVTRHINCDELWLLMGWKSS